MSLGTSGNAPKHSSHPLCSGGAQQHGAAESCNTLCVCCALGLGTAPVDEVTSLDTVRPTGLDLVGGPRAKVVLFV